MEKEKVIFFLFGDEKLKRKRSEILFCRGEENGDGKARLFLEMENIFLFVEKKRKRRKIFGIGRYIHAKAKKNSEGKGGNYHGERK